MLGGEGQRSGTDLEKKKKREGEREEEMLSGWKSKQVKEKKSENRKKKR